MDSQRTITEVVRTFQLVDGEQVAAVRCSDGGCGIARNGRLMESLFWRLDQLDECIEFAMRFAQTSGPKSSSG